MTYFALVNKSGKSTLISLHHKPGFYSFTETDIICNQQIDIGHINRTDHRVKLIILYGYSTTER